MVLGLALNFGSLGVMARDRHVVADSCCDGRAVADAQDVVYLCHPASSETERAVGGFRSKVCGVPAIG